MNKQPERTAQTKQNIINSFWEVVKKRGLHNTTISEVSQKAKINRGTFYVYFSDIESLLKYDENRIIDDFRTKLIANINPTDLSDFQAVTQKVIELVGNYDEKLFILISKNGDPQFLDKIRKEAIIVFRPLLKTDEEKYYIDYIIAFMTSAFTGLLQFWHDTGKEIPLSNLANIAHELALHGLSHMQLENE